MFYFSHIIDMFGKFIKDDEIPDDHRTIEKFQGIISASRILAGGELLEVVEHPPPQLLAYRSEVILWDSYWPDEDFPWPYEIHEKEFDDLMGSRSGEEPTSDVESRASIAQTNNEADHGVISTDPDVSDPATETHPTTGATDPNELEATTEQNEQDGTDNTPSALSKFNLDAADETFDIQPADAQATESIAERKMKRPVPQAVLDREAAILRHQITLSIQAMGSNKRLPEWAPNGAPLYSVRFPVENFNLVYFGFDYNNSSVSAEMIPKLNIEQNVWKGVFVLRAAAAMHGVHQIYYMWIEFSGSFQHLAEVYEWACALDEVADFLWYWQDRLIKRYSGNGFTLELPAIDKAWRDFVEFRYQSGGSTLKIEELTEGKDWAKDWAKV